MPTSVSDILVRIVMSAASGLPEDEIVNDLAFRWNTAGAPTDVNLLLLSGDIDNFFNVNTAGGFKIAGYIGEQVNRAATHEHQFFTIQTPLGSPRLVLPWLGPSAPVLADSNSPTEVAAVLSFHGDLTGVLEESGLTRPRARRRGRIFLGPLTTGGIYGFDPAPPLHPNLRTTMAQAFVRLCDEALADGFVASVWSRANDELYPVVGGWTDDAPDTQRRRGQAASNRAVFTL